MRKTLTALFIILLAGSSLPRASAQAAAPAVAGAVSPLRGDTAVAVQRLFSGHRTGGYVWAAIGAAFTGRVLGASIGEGFSNAGGTVVGIAVFGGVPGGIGISKLSRFSKAREEAALADFRQYHRLPPYVQRRLKARYF